MVITQGDEFLNNTAGGKEGSLEHRMPSSQNLVQLNSDAYNNINMAKIQIEACEPNPESRVRLSAVKDVLKNSKTLKEQLKGVCLCYDSYVNVQSNKEDQKAMSLMKNFFLQIVNKSQGEIIKYKQAYETQRERRKEIEAKLTQTADEIQREAKKNFLEHEEINKKMNER